MATPNTQQLSLTPKSTFLSDKPRAAAHSDMMASPAFSAAAQAAMLQYQYNICGNEVTSATVTGLKLKGAQDFLHVLMNLGLPTAPSTSMTDHALTPPEEVLRKLSSRLETPIDT